MIILTMFSWLKPITRKAAVTVRLAGEKIAPANKTCMCCQVFLRKFSLICSELCYCLLAGLT
jgi:hypothetical protein